MSADPASVDDDRPWLSSYPDGVPADVEIPPITMPDLVRSAARTWPDAVATDFFGATRTWAQIDDEVGRAAAGLRDLGVGKGDHVSLIMPNSRSHVVAFHAVMRLGAVVVEHNPLYATAELHDQFALTESTFAIVWRNRVADVREAAQGTALRTVVAVDLAQDLPRLSRLALTLPVKAARAKRAALSSGSVDGAVPWSRVVRSSGSGAAADELRPEDTALMLFTGGTTGTPKAAEITHGNLMANVAQGVAWAAFTPGEETVYGMLPFFHAFGMLFCLVLPASIGATLVAFPNFDPDAVIAAQKRRPATFLPGVGPMFSRLLAAAADAGADLTSIRLAFSGAMPLGREVTSQWEQATQGLLIEGYGMSESSPISLGNPCSDRRRPGALGIPFPNTRIRIVDQDDPTVEAMTAADGSKHGELLVKGPQVFKGYWKRPEDNAGVFVDGWLRTGDVVNLDADGFAVLVDRVKEMIIVGGFKVFPSEVESHLIAMEGIAEVAIVGVPRADVEGDEEVLAVIVPSDPNAPPTLEAVRAFAEARLPHYALPRRIEITDELPRSMIGKIMRRTVRENYL